ncbi:hypothetical protein WJX73_003631 [Symbiochloris irregularis]|uniref:DUF1517 domain-containing protein n=1 Tax=Symbiochloris irregularis TaxID=706552 RepID=A0AAW1Q000_9CHLO
MRPGMQEEPKSFLDRLLKLGKRGLTIAFVVLSVAALCANPASAARSGGRVGGSSFGSARASSSFGGSRSSGFGGGSSSFGGLSRSHTPSLRASGASASFMPVFLGGGYGAGGGGIGSVLVWVVVAAVAFGAFQSFMDSKGGDRGLLEAGADRVSVVKLQVGLLGTARGMQRDLDRIASRADTSGPSGLHYVLQETVLGLARNPDQCIYGAATVSNERSLDGGEDAFNRLSMEERGKVKEETLVNYGGRSRSGSYSNQRSSNGVQELIVVTILVAVRGGLKMPRVTSGEELKTALNRLGAIRSEQTLAVEVLWTPQDDTDYYTKDEMMSDFPALNNL